MTDFHAQRRDYAGRSLVEAELAPEPFTQFKRWFDDAVASGAPDAEAMTLATTGLGGAPQARTVLLKAFDGNGFVFFTNLSSAKSREIEADPRVMLCFFWRNLDRQVRVGGRAELVEDAVSDAYFASRPRGSQLGAWASPQSQAVTDRDELDNMMAEMEKRFPEDRPVPRPPFWGGWRVAPSSVEFWQGRESRLHDRLLYTQNGAGGWTVERLAP